jgi:hypothetical protein
MIRAGRHQQYRASLSEKLRLLIFQTNNWLPIDESGIVFSSFELMRNL